MLCVVARLITIAGVSQRGVPDPSSPSNTARGQGPLAGAAPSHADGPKPDDKHRDGTRRLERVLRASATNNAEPGDRAGHAEVLGAGGATSRRWRGLGCARCAFSTRGLRLSGGSHSAMALSRLFGVVW
jgi:hypothetical protein